jgi:hypothetical protein
MARMSRMDAQYHFDRGAFSTRSFHPPSPTPARLPPPHSPPSPADNIEDDIRAGLGRLELEPGSDSSQSPDSIPHSGPSK